MGKPMGLLAPLEPLDVFYNIKIHKQLHLLKQFDLLSIINIISVVA